MTGRLGTMLFVLLVVSLYFCTY